MYLLDTNTVIYYLKSALPPKAMQILHAIVDERPMLSVITKMELLGFNYKQMEEQLLMTQFTQASYMLNIDDEIVANTISLRKQFKIKLPDAIIAATAISHNLILLTHNTTDFTKIQKLTVIDPFLL